MEGVLTLEGGTLQKIEEEGVRFWRQTSWVPWRGGIHGERRGRGLNRGACDGRDGCEMGDELRGGWWCEGSRPPCQL